MLPDLSEIAKRRKRLGITQKKLARLAGVSQSFIAKLESGIINPSYNKVKVIFEILDTLEKQNVREDLTAKDIMSSNVVGIAYSDSVSKASELMLKYGYSQLPVFKGSRVVGSISEKTILDKISKGLDFRKLSKLKVKDIMEEPFPQVPENTPVPVIATLLGTFLAVLVVREEKIIGIITKSDLLKIVK